MAGAASVCACLLALVFGWAAVAKGVAYRGTVSAFRDLGVPVASVAAVAVPLVEIGVAVALIGWPAVGASLALALLAAFTLVVVRAVSAGSRAGCACFGARRVEPVSPTDVIRNGVLAAFAVVATGTSRLVRPGVGAVIAVAVAVACGGALLRVAARRVAR